MSPIAHLRRLRRLPHVLLAVLAIAVAQTSLIPCSMAYGAMAYGATASSDAMDVLSQAVDLRMPAMEEHCAYCPPDASTPADVNVGDCVYTHAPTIDVFPGSAHYVDSIFSSPLLHASAFDVSSLRSGRAFVPLVYSLPSHPRPLTLTYCVQLK